MKKEEHFSFTLKRKNKKLMQQVSPLALGGILIITTIVLIRPLISSVLTTRQTLSEKNQELTTMIEKNKQLLLLQSNTQGLDLDKLLVQTEEYIPSEKPSLATLMSLLQLARKEQVFLSGLSLTPGKITLSNLPAKPANSTQTSNIPNTVTASTAASSSANNADSFALSFSVVGNKLSLQSFIEKIREIAPMMTIERFDIKLTKGSIQTEVAEMTTSVNVKVYYKGLPATISPANKPIQQLTEADKELIASMQSYLFLDQSFRPMQNVDTGTVVQAKNSNPFAGGQ